MTRAPLDPVEAALDAIEAVFDSAEGRAYLGEEVTMIQHQLQAGALAVDAGAPAVLVVGALLHDIGHMVGCDEGEPVTTDARNAGSDHHDSSGARWLARWFGPEVTGPVRLHVAAKRFLVATEAGYAAKLSAASVHSLAMQGGPMDATEIAAFRADRHYKAAVALRRFDEAAKDASFGAPPIATHRAVIERVLRMG